jgi:hypothetical protein
MILVTLQHKRKTDYLLRKFRKISKLSMLFTLSNAMLGFLAFKNIICTANAYTAS